MEKKKNEVNPEEMNQAADGIHWPNLFRTSVYNKAGIRVKEHIFEKDEFWWRGSNIGEDNANAVVRFIDKNGRAPDSLVEALHPGSHPKDMKYGHFDLKPVINH